MKVFDHGKNILMKYLYLRIKYGTSPKTLQVKKYNNKTNEFSDELGACIIRRNIGELREYYVEDCGRGKEEE